MAAAREPDSENAGYLATEWDQPMPVDEITGQRDVFGDGRIELLPLPGHTPGSIGALAHLDRSGTFLLAGDTVSLRETLDSGIIPRNTWNADALVNSLDEVRRIEASGAAILCSHDAAQWDRLRKGIDAYE
jgi:N-acyl homoserine lactone hydrolase